jgi:hypothetical protein
MKKIILFLLILLIIPSILANDFYYNDKKVKLQVDIASHLKIIDLSSDSELEYIKIYLSFYPKEDFRQKVIQLKTIPKANEKNKSLVYKWDNPSQRQLSFNLNSIIETHNNVIKVKKRVSFPIKYLPEQYRVYTQPTKNIDSTNEKIIKAASQLAEGENDLYVVVHKIATWVEKNIEYSLNTLTADVSQKASWVLENKNGVCDELTTLFIAMLRSLGIPAKYISGVAYTNWNEINDFGPHAWAEVYFPDYGWIAFDLTYNELGYIDPSHIKLKEDLDSDESSIKYEWKAVNIKLDTQKLDIKTRFIEKSDKIDNDISIKAKAVKRNIGFGSYNTIEVEIKNLRDYYVSTTISLSRTKGVEAEVNRKNILLRPNENKKIYFIIKIVDNLNKNYQYTFPVSIYNEKNISSNLEFYSSFNEPFYSKEEIEDIINQNKEEQQKRYSKNVNLKCTAKEEFYDYEEEFINCKIKNTGNVFLENIKLCSEKECREFNLGISQEKIITFLINTNKTGKKDIMIKAISKDISKSDYISIIILDKPKINIEDIKHPVNISFDGKYSISFTLKKQSLSIPKDINIKLKQNTFFKEWSIDKLIGNQKFMLNFKGNNLDIGNNNFKIIIDYKDNNNKKYHEEESFVIRLENVTLFQRIQIKLSNIGKWLDYLFKQMYVHSSRAKP